MDATEGRSGWSREWTPLVNAHKRVGHLTATELVEEERAPLVFLGFA
ncbi:hypothetical protein [Arthrobacter gyeryongensis]